MTCQCVGTTTPILAYVTFCALAAVTEMGERMFVERLASGETQLTGGSWKFKGGGSKETCPLTGHSCSKPATTSLSTPTVYIHHIAMPDCAVH
jgi:hypothetical protein